MLSYSLHNDTLNWTVDSVTNRLKYHSTRIEQFWDDQNIPQYGRVGAGYPNVYQAMIDRGAYHVVELVGEQQSLKKKNFNPQCPYPITAGDTLLATVAICSRVGDYDTITVDLFSSGCNINCIDQVRLYAVNADDTAYGTAVLTLPSDLTPGVQFDIQAEITCSGGFCDTLFFRSFEGVSAKPWLTRSEFFPRYSGGEVSDYWPRAVSYGNVDVDSNLEAVFYLFDSLYCVDMSTGGKQKRFPKPCAALDTSDMVPKARILAPAVGDVNGNGIDEILYSPSRTSISLINGLGMPYHWSFPLSSPEYYVSPVLADVDMDGVFDIVHLASNKLYLYRMGVPDYELPYTLKTITVADDICFRTASGCVGDMTGDGIPEIVASASPSGGQGNAGFYIMDYLNNTPVYTYVGGPGDESFGAPKLADFDADGLAEALCPYAISSNQSAYLWVIEFDPDSACFRSNRLLTINGQGFVIPINDIPTAFSLFDINRNHFPNVMVIHSSTSYTRVFSFDSTGSGHLWLALDDLVPYGSYRPYAGSVVNQAAVGYINSDSVADLCHTTFECPCSVLYDSTGQLLFGNEEAAFFDPRSVPIEDSLGNAWSVMSLEGQPSIARTDGKTIIGDYKLWRCENDTVDDRMALSFYELDEAGEGESWLLQRGNSQLTGNYRVQLGGTLAGDITIRDTVYLVGDLVIPSGDTCRRSERQPIHRPCQTIQRQAK